MTRRLPILMLGIFLALALGLVWRSLAGGPELAEPALSGPDSALAPRAPEQRAAELDAAPTAPPEEPQSAREVVVPEPLAESSAPAIPEDSYWIEGRVLFPEKLPLDEDFEVEARGRRFGRQKGAPREHRVRAEPDGRFRVAFAAKTRKGWLNLRARYMYLAERVKVDVKKQQGDVVLEPLLGGVLRGLVHPPAGHEPNAETFAGARVHLSAWRESGPFQRSAQVDEGGHFELGALPPAGDYRLELVCQNFAGEERNGLSVRAGEVTELELGLTPGVRLAGRVLEASGEPVVRAELKLAAVRKSGMNVTTNFESTWTDAQGAFEFPVLRPCSATLTVRAEGAAEIVDELGELEEGAHRRDLVYTPARGQSISGTVSWEDGTPASGVNVTGRSIEADGELDWNSREFATTTDEHGKFELTGLDQRKLVVDARGRRLLAPEEGAEAGRRKRRGPRLSARADKVEPGTRGVHLVLSRGELIRGSVLLAGGQAVGPFRVLALPDRNDRGTLNNRDRVEGKFENATGEFELAGLKPGAWRISVKGAGLAESESQPIRVPHDAPLTFVLQRAASVRGRVLSPGAEPVAGAPITLIRVDGGTETWANGETITNSRGEFTLDGLTPGPIRLRAESEHYAPGEEVSLTLLPGEQREGVDIVMSTGCRLTGVVLPSAGEVAQRQVTVSGGDPRTYEVAVTDDRGSFELANLTPGDYEARLQPAGEAQDDWALRWVNSATVKFELAPGGSTHVELGLGPAQPVSVHGVVTSGGSPLADYVVHFVGRDNQQAATRSDENGAYALTVDGRGSYAVTLRPASREFGVNYLVFQVEIGEESEHREDFDLPTASLYVTLLDPDGNPAGDALVGLEKIQPGDEPANFASQMSADAQGHFEFLHIEAGDYRLLAGGARSWGKDGGGFARQTLEVTIDASAREARTLRLEPGGVVRVLAVYPDGTPADARAVVALDARGVQVSSPWANTDPGGRFQLRGLPGGELTIRVGGKDGRGESAVSLARGGEAEVSVTVPR